MSLKNLRQNQEACYTAVEQLHKHSHITPENYQALTGYKNELKDEIKCLKAMIKFQDCDVEKTTPILNDLEAELEWLENNAVIYTTTRISLHTMSCLFTMRILGNLNSGYSMNPYYDFKELVEQINCYYDINEPYKPSNKIAYGWKFCLDKGNPRDAYKGARLYLWGCIKNYLIKNGVEFTKATSLEVRKIVGLVDVTPEDC